MTKRFTTNGYKIYDTFHDGIHWLVNQVEANEIVDKMNNLDSKARERSKALSKLQKENEQLKHNNKMLSMKMSEVSTKYRLLKEFSDDTNPNEAVKTVLHELMMITKEYR